jgi:2-C-methyl-D-erythritol 4-phosphate cytidylyltransferase
MRHGLVLTAAGHSTRFGGGSKVLVTLGGIAVLVRAATPFLEALDDLDVVITARAEDRDAFEAVVRSTPELTRARVVTGGATRSESVRLGVEALAPEVSWVLVHDAARPCVTAPLVRRVLAAAKAVGAAVPGLPVADTVHRVDAQGLVVESPRRESLRAVQTPQVARRDLLRRAYAHASTFALAATDEAGLLAAAGIPIAVVEGDPANVKVTTREDLERLELRFRAG